MAEHRSQPNWQQGAPNTASTAASSQMRTRRQPNWQPGTPKTALTAANSTATAGAVHG